MSEPGVVAVARWVSRPSHRTRITGAVLALCLVACETTPQPTPTPIPPPVPSPTPAIALDELPFSVWEQLRIAIRQSSDHLPAAAERVVATRDAEAIFAFVRDEIATLPPSPTGWRGAESLSRWGTRATLRGGAGTPRDKAELLVELYELAGFEASILVGELQLPAEATGRAILFRTIPRVFEPGVTEAQLDEWLRLLGADPAIPPSAAPDLEPVRAAIVESLGTAATLPGPGPAFDWASLSLVPIVEVTINGQKTFANPMIPDAELGTSYTGTAVPTGPVGPALPVNLSILVTTAREPTKRIEVATGSWPIDEVIGRAIQAQFVPAGDPRITAQLRADQIQTFVPTLSLRGADLDPAGADGRTIVGDAVTVRGTVIRTSEGSVTVGTRPLTPAPADLDALLASVAALRIEVDPAAYPSIRGRASIVDSGGAPVVGLPGAALRLVEDGLDLSFVLEENHPAPPRVILVFDTSGSMPPAFSAGGAVKMARDFTTRIVTARPGALVRAAAIASGGAASLHDYTADPDVIEDEIRTMIGYGSDVWTATANAAAYDPTAIVLISDGQSSETLEAIGKARPLVAAGPPVIAIGVGAADMATLGAIAGATGGRAVAAGNSADAIAAVLEEIAAQTAFPYRFAFESPLDGATSRSLAMRLAGNAAPHGDAVYDVPAVDDRLAPPRLAGIYLRVEYHGREFVHTIAGPNAYDPQPAMRLTPELLEETNAALFSATLLSVEGSPPTTAAWFDDQLTAKLSLRPAYEAAKTSDGEAILTGLADVLVIPPEIVDLHAPLPDSVTADSLTYGLEPRFVAYGERFRWDTDVIRSASILPLSRWVTIADDPDDARRLTLERTAALAALESALFKTSTVSILEGRALADVPPFSLLDPTRPPSRFALAAFNEWQRAVPTDESVGAFWAIDPETGTLLGVLPDASGGGATSSTESKISQLGQIAALLGIIAGILGAGFPVVGFIAIQRAILAQILREAAIVAAIGEDAIPAENLDTTLQELTCDLAKAAAGGISKATNVLGYEDGVLQTLTGKSFPCPW